MQKTIQQSLNYLSQPFKSDADFPIIQAMFSQLYGESYEPVKREISSDGITAYDYKSWLDEGVGTGDIVRYGNKLGIVTGHVKNAPEISCYIEGGKLFVGASDKPSDDYETVTEGERDGFYRTLGKHDLQYDSQKSAIIKKYVPKVNDRVKFFGNGGEGIAIVRSVDAAKDVMEFYCYYIFPTNEKGAEIGFSMHEDGIATLSTFTFEALSIGYYRRLQNELRNRGYLWNDKLKRIEPSDYRRDKGKPYWYISDKFRVVKEMDNWTPKSNERFLTGNYFTSLSDAMDMQGRITDERKDMLAKGR